MKTSKIDVYFRAIIEASLWLDIPQAKARQVVAGICIDLINITC